MNDWFTQALASIELVIRYLVSGAAVYAIYVLSVADTAARLTWVQNHLPLAAFIATAAGFVAYSFYRATFWIIGDGVGWLLGLSAPSLVRKDSKLYAAAYAEFLEWRRDPGLHAPLSNYLHYRWAVVHFLYILGFALLHSLVWREAQSVIDQWPRYAGVVMAGALGISTWQASFLFRVERELFRKRTPQ